MCGLGTGSFVFFKSGWNSRAWGWQHTVRARRLMGQLPRESVNHQSGRPSEFGNFQIQIFQHDDCNGLVWRVIREDELECLWLPASKSMIHVKWWFQCPLCGMLKYLDLRFWEYCFYPVLLAKGASKSQEQQALGSSRSFTSNVFWQLVVWIKSRAWGVRVTRWSLSFLLSLEVQGTGEPGWIPKAWGFCDVGSCPVKTSEVPFIFRKRPEIFFYSMNIYKNSDLDTFSVPERVPPTKPPVCLGGSPMLHKPKQVP